MEIIKIKGIVGYGKQLGRTVGMPTINLETKQDVSAVKDGVYGTRAWIDGQCFVGITNVGCRPSVDKDSRRTIETHLLDFSQDIYGKEVEIELHNYIRGVKKFNSIEEVMRQVKKDIEQIYIS